MDSGILLFIQENIRNEILNPIVIFITHLGDSGRIWILIAIILLLFSKTRRIGIMMIGAMLMSLIFNNFLLKNLVARVRPYEVIEGLNRIIEAQVDWSFPSGHTASSFAAAIVILKTSSKKYGIMAIILAIMISLSRLYVGVHYPTDVLFGMISGTLIAYFTVFIFNKYYILKEENG